MNKKMKKKSVADLVYDKIILDSDVVVSLSDIKLKTKEKAQEYGVFKISNELGSVNSNTTISMHDFKDRVCNGHSFMCMESNGSRKIEGFVKNELFALDFDNKDLDSIFTPDDLINRCKKYGFPTPAIIYKSYSCSDDVIDKYRIIYRHDIMINDPVLNDCILKLLSVFFNEADSAAIDVPHFFFGGKGSIFDDKLNINDTFNAVHLKIILNKYLNDCGEQPSSIKLNKKMLTIQELFDKRITEELKTPILREAKGDEMINNKNLIYFSSDDDIMGIPWVFEQKGLTTDNFKDLNKNSNNKNSNNKNSNKSNNDNFFGAQTKEKLESALKVIPPDIDYNKRNNIIWGIKNSYGEDAWELVFKWYSGNLNTIRNDINNWKSKSESYIKKKWNDNGQSGKINVGAVYNIAKEFNWKFEDSVIKRYNKKYFVSHLNNKTRVFYNRANPLKKNVLELKWMEFSDFKQLNASDKYKIDVNGVTKTVNAADYWLNHEHRKVYLGGVHFDPSNSLPKDCYNEWRGFAYKSFELTETNYNNINKSIIGGFLDHLKRNVCDNNMEHYEYLIKWMALCVQKPEFKPGVVVILRGDNGVGKSKVAEVFGSLFGNSFMTISNESQILGNHNDHLRNCIFLSADDSFFGGNKSTNGQLKNLVTDKALLYNPKGIGQFIAPSYLHIMMTSNEDFVVPASGNERRYFVLDVKPNNRRDYKFFRSIDEDMENGGFELLLSFFKSVDLSDFEVRDNPETEALNDIKLDSLDYPEQYILQLLHKGELIEWEKWGVIERDLFYNNYIDYVKLRGGISKFKQSHQYIGKIINKLFDGKVLRKTRNKKPTFVFPNLKKCRELFVKNTNCKIDWDTIEDDNDLNGIISINKKLNKKLNKNSSKKIIKFKNTVDCMSF